jgi:murein DD-endopeptidase MepM/ murein hydrolase activator NlpD
MLDHNADGRPTLGVLRCALATLIRCGVMLVVLATQLAPSPAAAQLSEPVEATVVDTFRPPVHIGAPGNRGWEYAVQPGTAVLAAADGVVAFAGQIGPHRYVSVDHPSGLRTSYSFLASTAVQRGDTVRRGTVVGTTTDQFHFGVRRNGEYLDPATVVGGVGLALRAHLVPVADGPVRVGLLMPLSGPSQYTLGLARPWVR